MFDFLPLWKASEKEKRTIYFYLSNGTYHYELSSDNHYCYSCKFIDRKGIEYYAGEIINDLQYYNIKNIKEDIITAFLKDFIDYMESLDNDYESFGYKYLYEIDDTEAAEICNANDYYFTTEGEYYGQG